VSTTVTLDRNGSLSKESWSSFRDHGPPPAKSGRPYGRVYDLAAVSNGDDNREQAVGCIILPTTAILDYDNDNYRSWASQPAFYSYLSGALGRMIDGKHRESTFPLSPTVEVSAIRFTWCIVSERATLTTRHRFDFLLLRSWAIGIFELSRGHDRSIKRAHSLSRLIVRNMYLQGHWHLRLDFVRAECEILNFFSMQRRRFTMLNVDCSPRLSDAIRRFWN
jgi:hypothetical protein